MQRLNFKLLGLKLCERIPKVSRIQLVVDIVIKVLSCHDNLDTYLMIGDAYLDIIFENQLDAFPNVLLDGIFERALEEKIGENELVTLQSILSKCITHFGNIASIFGLNHFVDILDMTYGSSRNSIYLHILSMATRNGHIQDPTIIEVLMQVAQALYDGVDFSNMRKDDYQHPSRVISHFVFMVTYNFASISELQSHVGNGSSNISFIKSCLAFSEVTIPSIPTSLRQLNLYLETAEVALLGGFVSHSDGLIDAAVNCLRNLDSVDGLPIPEDVNGVISSMCKLCGMLVMVPGSLEQGVACIPKQILYFLDSRSWILPRMKTKVLSAVVFLSAALAQNQLLYHTRREVIGNNQLFFGVPSYSQELLSLDGVILHDIVNIVLQEPSMAIRGKIALEFCNCIASVFTMTDETLEACSKLVGIARSCLSADNKFLQSTLMFLDEHQFRL
ncbi:hypothetical protein ACJIZ3_013098 [Penstemon smallii]|uniref:Uncharacterized protein n=1 Tax=Penstemon smallii TaxID=265156 RepID=A0ABD3UQF4_9LAMI